MNIVEVIIKEFIDQVPWPLGIDPYSQGQIAERRRLRKLLTGMQLLPGSDSSKALPAIGLGDIGQALIDITKKEMTQKEIKRCTRYASRLMSRFAKNKTKSVYVLAVCGMIIVVANEIQTQIIRGSAQTSKQ